MRCVTPDGAMDNTSSGHPEPIIAARDGAAALVARESFLSVLGRTGNPSSACKESGLTRRQINVMKQRDASFAIAYDEALDDAADLLEAEAWRRALEGIEQPVLKAGLPVLDPVTHEPMIVRRYSDPLLVLLLRGFKPGKFQTRSGTAPAIPDPGAAIREIGADDDPPRAGPGR